MASLKSVLQEILSGNVPVEEQERMLLDVQESIKKTLEQKKAKEERINSHVDTVLKALQAVEQRVNDKLIEISQLPAKVGAQGPAGRDGKDGNPGKDGRDGKAGRDGKDGQDGADGQDGVSVVDAKIDFDNSLTIYLSNGAVIDAGSLNFNLSGIEGVAVIKQAAEGGGGGGGSSDITVVSVALGSGTIADSAQTVLVNASSDCTLTLPSAASNNGKMIYFKNLTTNQVTLVGSGGELIDGDASLIIQFQYSSLRLISDGTAWYIF
jgi:hypothetical protein